MEEMEEMGAMSTMDAKGAMSTKEAKDALETRTPAPRWSARAGAEEQRQGRLT